MLQTPSLADLVIDDAAFRVRTDAYADPDVFAAEMERIFARGWVYVAHESEVPAPGDYKTVSIGNQPIIVTRHEDGTVHLLYNRCRHRAAVVCREELGHSNYFRCPYHAWVYNNDGSIVGMAQATGWPKDFDKTSYGLQHLAHVASYRGLIFASLGEDAQSFDAYIAPVRPYIDLWADRSPTGRVRVIRPPHKYDYPGNWKWQAENGHDGYHGNYVHESWQKILARAGESEVKEIRDYRLTGCTRGLGNGHGLLERPAGLNPAASWTGRLMATYPEYARALRDRFEEGYIEEVAARRNILVFPNVFLFDTHIRVITPVAVDKTEVSLWVYDFEDVPAALNEDRYRAHERFYGPSGFGSPDDVEIFIANQTGVQAKGVDHVLLSRGLHRETVNERGERIGHSTDETPVRAFYREWRRRMADG
jgi:benzoate/toluate 1,2-dioxygenase alpha subunit